MAKAQFGVLGLAVMGQNLAMNVANKGFTVAVFNRSRVRTDEMMAGPAKGNKKVIPTYSEKELCEALETPRRILIMVKAGAPVDEVISQLKPFLQKGDMIIDGGNSLFKDTERRVKALEAEGYAYIGTGVSGGEEGALKGPCIMPGGTKKAYEAVEAILTKISAQVDDGPCCAYIGPRGAGHYVKMIHNGIEYIDMQLIGEAYGLLSSLLGMKAPELAKVFDTWNEGGLDSYLIQITADILQQPDPVRKGEYLVDYVLDTAGQKGTGKWTAVNALDMGIPANSIAEAVFSRCMSAIKEERVEAAKQLGGPKAAYAGDRAQLINAVRDALYCSKICAYAQGFQLMREAQKEYQWKLDFATIASIWRGGCIIRARFLQKITDAYTRNPNLVNLLLDPYFNQQIQKGQENWRSVVALAAGNGIAAPAFMSALAYYDGYRSARLPANLLQAQRDYFGAHTYERTDQPRGKFFHLDWPEKGRPQIEVMRSGGGH